MRASNIISIWLVFIDLKPDFCFQLKVYVEKNG